ncbi:hypothetical protein BLS_002255 [Venturia inaequalis]|uniref:Uncharacterized protein n=1 Tax=Venturia inaequalis TaxID=5025 RepID=A0A8H3YIC6_VENIN|nr:hypothetical protein BLS_002255 [Venturia inaequalis]
MSSNSQSDKVKLTSNQRKNRNRRIRNKLSKQSLSSFGDEDEQGEAPRPSSERQTMDNSARSSSRAPSMRAPEEFERAPSENTARNRRSQSSKYLGMAEVDDSLDRIEEEHGERPRASSNIPRSFSDFDRPIRAPAHRDIDDDSDEELPVDPRRRFSRNLGNNMPSSSGRSPRQDGRPIESIEGRPESSRRELSSQQISNRARPIDTGDRREELRPEPRPTDPGDFWEGIDDEPEPSTLRRSRRNRSDSRAIDYVDLRDVHDDDIEDIPRARTSTNPLSLNDPGRQPGFRIATWRGPMRTVRPERIARQATICMPTDEVMSIRTVNDFNAFLDLYSYEPKSVGHLREIIYVLRALLANPRREHLVPPVWRAIVPRLDILDIDSLEWPIHSIRFWPSDSRGEIIELRANNPNRDPNAATYHSYHITALFGHASQGARDVPEEHTCRSCSGPHPSGPFRDCRQVFFTRDGGEPRVRWRGACTNCKWVGTVAAGPLKERNQYAKRVCSLQSDKYKGSEEDSE